MVFVHSQKNKKLTKRVEEIFSLGKIYVQYFVKVISCYDEYNWTLICTDTTDKNGFLNQYESVSSVSIRVL